MDKLKKYTNQNATKFDDYDLDEVDKLRLWSNIVSELPQKPINVIPLWKKIGFGVAASIILFVVCSLFFVINTYQNQENQMVNQELYEINNHYKHLVDNQIQLIKNSSVLSKEDQDDFLLLVDDLDIEYNKLKAELKLGINNEKIIEAIITNYRKKIQLMEDLLQRSYPIKNSFEDGELVL